jgi:hypothetical protein
MQRVLLILGSWGEGVRLTREEADDLVDWLAERLEDSLPAEVQVERRWAMSTATWM